jgi:hypothetical protein
VETQLRISDRVNDVHGGDATVGGPGFNAVDHPLIGGLVEARVGADRGGVAAGIGFTGTQRGQSRIACRAEEFGKPIVDLLVCGRTEKRPDRQIGTQQCLA